VRYARGAHDIVRQQSPHYLPPFPPPGYTLCTISVGDTYHQCHNFLPCKRQVCGHQTRQFCTRHAIYSRVSLSTRAQRGNLLRYCLMTFSDRGRRGSSIRNAASMHCGLSTKCDARPECDLTTRIFSLVELLSKERSADLVAASSSEKAENIQSLSI